MIMIGIIFLEGLEMESGNNLELLNITLKVLENLLFLKINKILIQNILEIIIYHNLVQSSLHLQEHQPTLIIFSLTEIKMPIIMSNIENVDI